MDHIDRIRKLLAMADSTTFPAEAESFRAKAHKMMEQYKVTEAQVRPPQQAPQPVIMQGWGNPFGIPGFGNGMWTITPNPGMGNHIGIWIRFG